MLRAWRDSFLPERKDSSQIPLPHAIGLVPARKSSLSLCRKNRCMREALFIGSNWRNTIGSMINQPTASNANDTVVPRVGRAFVHEGVREKVASQRRRH